MKNQTINFSNRTWIVRDNDYHPTDLKEWYDASAVNVDGSGNLILKTHRNPREFHPANGNPITINTGSGRIYCEDEFSYGKFEALIKLPSGKELWPAFWLYAWDSWPPEIDILEAYSNKKSNYFKFNWSPFSLWHVETNVHYRVGENNLSIGGRRHWFGFKNPANSFINYSLEWRPNIIKIFYDGIFVRGIRDAEILNKIKDHKMKVVLNNSVLKGITHSPSSEMFVKNFKYEPY
jgi:beta-glucanase (GH16 family)